MWWTGRFASWMCSRQICSNCVLVSCQCGPKSLRNVSNTLLNLYHEELRQFWRQKGVQPGTSKVYLIKWPVSVYCNKESITAIQVSRYHLLLQKLRHPAVTVVQGNNTVEGNCLVTTSITFMSLMTLAPVSSKKNVTAVILLLIWRLYWKWHLRTSVGYWRNNSWKN